MKDMLMRGLFLFASKLMKGAGPYQEATVDLTRLKIAKGYLQTVRTFRLLFLVFLGSGACLVFLLTGLFLLHYTILVYAPWTLEAKVIVTLVFAFIYVSAAAAFFLYMFAEERWMKMFNTDEMIKELTGDKQ